MSRSNLNRFKQDNLYYNVEFLGNNSVPNQQMIYDTTLNESIVDNSLDYYATIVNFAIPLTCVPIMIMPMLPNGGVTENSTLTITFVVNGVARPTQIVKFVPEQLTKYKPIGGQTNPNEMIITPYYYLYSYDSLINMLNTTLLSAFADQQSAFPLILQSTQGTAPMFVYNKESQLISLIVHRSYATNVTQANTVTIQINNDLLTYLEGFCFKKVERLTTFLETFSEFNIYTRNENYYQQATIPYPLIPAVGNQYIEMKQSYNNMAQWSDLKKIIIVSNSLPVAGESIQRGTNINNVVNTQYVLSSFTPETSSAGEQRGVIYYNPSGQYRLLDIISDIDIRRIDITIYWEDFKNNWYVMDLFPNDNATVRLGFFKKDLYKSNLLKKM